MAVTIDEMHVQVAEPPPAAAPGAAPTEPKKDKDLHEELHLLHERKLRLKAD